MAEQRKCNWKTDLILIESFYELVEDGSSVPTAIPDDSIDFRIVYRCGPDKRHYTAERQNGIYLGCKKIDDNNLAVFLPLSRHSLGRGLLSRELFLSTPDDNFDHGVRNICIPASTGCILSEGPSDGDTPPEVTVIVERLLKGDKGDPGEAGQITSATASVDNTTGTPSVKIELGGTPEKRTIDLKFSGLKGEPGEPDESFVRYDKAQDLTTSEQNTALSNIGSELFVLDIENGQATLTDAQEAALLSSKGVILRGTVNAGKEVLTKIYFSDYQGGDIVNFFAIRNNEFCLRCSYTKSTKIFKFNTGVRWSNPTYVSVYSSQNFSMSEQAQARANIGVQSADELLADDDFIASLKTKLGIG